MRARILFGLISGAGFNAIVGTMMGIVAGGALAGTCAAGPVVTLCAPTETPAGVCGVAVFTGVVAGVGAGW
jgi:hypothetical protein